MPFGAVWRDLKRQNYISFGQLYLPSFSIKGPNSVFIDTLFKFRCNEICNKNKIGCNKVFCINLIDTTVNQITNVVLSSQEFVQEQWKILELTITMCLHYHAHCNCHFS